MPVTTTTIAKRGAAWWQHAAELVAALHDYTKHGTCGRTHTRTTVGITMNPSKFSQRRVGCTSPLNCRQKGEGIVAGLSLVRGSAHPRVSNALSQAASETVANSVVHRGPETIHDDTRSTTHESKTTLSLRWFQMTDNLEPHSVTFSDTRPQIAPILYWRH